MLDQLIIGTKASFDDFSASFSSRRIGTPQKKEIKETIPFSNKTFDFSAINGEVYWEERELEYEFEIIAPTPELLENAKLLFASWIMNIANEDIYDPFIKDYHFTNCTYSEMEFEDDESIEKTTAKVKFTAYPYKVANDEKIYSFTIPAGSTKEVEVINNSAHRIKPVFTADGSAVVLLNGETSFAVNTGDYEGVKLKAGANTLEIQNGQESELTLTVKFTEEVF